LRVDNPEFGLLRGWKRLVSAVASWKGLLHLVAGLALGLTLFYDIDPTFDSLFFATAQGLIKLDGFSHSAGLMLHGLAFFGTAGTLAMGILLATGSFEILDALRGLH
jgi:hypothetical protein